MKKIKVVKKSRACSKVLQLMDSEEDATYCWALRTVLSKDKRLSKKSLSLN